MVLVISALTYTGAWKGLAGGNALPQDAASTVYPDWGIIAPSSWTAGNRIGYDGFVYIDDGRPAPNTNDWTTWRDRWLESAIREAYQPV